MSEVLSTTSNRVTALERLTTEIPGAKCFEDGSSIEAQARAVLNYVLKVDNLMLVRTADCVARDCTTCPNCSVQTPSTRSPYCGSWCRESAAFVRQVRTGLIDGMIFDADRQVALGQVLWHLLGGGRPLRLSLVPDRTKLQVISKAEGRCLGCGDEATTVDHIGSGCNRSINLRPVCAACTSDRQFGDKRLVESLEFRMHCESIGFRIANRTPVRCCDDVDTWDWRQYLKERGAML